MSIQIDMSREAPPIDFAPTPEAELIQNVRTILTTIQGTVPLDRAFGIEHTITDEPTLIARARLTSAIVAAVKEYEPRVNVTQVEYKADDDQGRLIPIVYIEPVEEGDR